VRRITFPRKSYNYFIKKWIVSAFILTLAAHWMLFLKFFGKNVGLITAQGALTSFANWITWPMFILSLLFALLKTAADNYNEQAKNKGHFILERLLQSVNAVATKKMQRFCSYAEENRTKSKLTPFKDITKPREQIISLLENIQVTLSELFGINRDEIGLSIICKPIGDNEWQWLPTVNMQNDIDLQTLVSNPSTTAKQIIDGKGSSIFFPDKQVAVQKNQYLPGPNDTTYDNTGSVLCRDISIGTDEKIIRAILSITTYGKQLCEENDDDAKYKIENLLMPTFEKRIQLELALFYIKEILNPKCMECP